MRHGGIAITTRQVLRDGWPILLVTHDADDGAWQFVNGHGHTEDAGSAMVVGVETVSSVDPTVALFWPGSEGRLGPPGSPGCVAMRERD